MRQRIVPVVLLAAGFGWWGCSSQGLDENANGEEAVLEQAATVCTSAPVGTARYQNATIPAQTGKFQAEWDVTPSAPGTDGGVGLSARAASDWSDLAVIVRFNGDANVIDARNGSAYAAAARIPYAAGSKYHVRVAVDVAAHRYSAYVTPPTGGELLVGKDFAFRTEQASVTSLVNRDVNASAGSLSACGFVLTPASAPPPSTDGGTTPPPPPPTGPSQSGTIALQLAADKGAATNAVVSAGVPFPPGVLRDGTLVALKDAAGAAVPVQARVLATWPSDGSVRSVLVLFRASLASGATARYTLAYGAAPTVAAPTGLVANPDGPVAATLPATWYTASKVSGALAPAATNTRFAAFDKTMEAKIGSMSPAYESYGVACDTTTNHRTYYDGPHGLFTRFLRYGDAAKYRRARTEAIWYRANELRYSADGTLAWQTCQGTSWTPSTALGWGVIRRMTGQGMLDDYLLTGDDAARKSVVAMGEAFRQNLPALVARSTPDLEATERNMAWTLMGLAAYYSIDHRAEVLTAMRTVVDRAIAWQGRGTSGAFEHDIVAADPSECSNGPKGGSPFMTSLLVDALMDYYTLTQDARVVEVVRKAAVWYETKARTSDGLAFRYLWNCLSDPYDSSDVADLNMLIVHVFGAAYALTKDTHWLDFGDTMADHGLDAMYVGRPKQWNQSARAFPRYLGYRAAGRTP